MIHIPTGSSVGHECQRFLVTELSVGSERDSVIDSEDGKDADVRSCRRLS